MTLPIIDSPIFTIELPSNKQKISFRPFTVKEEKILFMAFETIKQTQGNENDKEISNENLEIVKNSIKQVILNCLINKSDYEKLSYFDFEYLFINLRSKSVNNIVEKRIIDKEDNKEYNIKIDLDKVTVIFPKKINNEIILNDEYSVFLKYPSFDTLLKMKEDENHDNISSVIIILLDKLLNKNTDDVTLFNEYSEKDKKKFVDSFPMSSLNKIYEFMTDLPVIYLKTSYKRKDGTEKEIELKGLYDFFT